MSRYLILVLLNTPLIIAGIVGTVVAYKLKRISLRRLIFGLIFWFILFAGLVAAEPLYNFLFSNQLTNTEPLSLFDVIQITGIILTLLLATKAYGRVVTLEHTVRKLHQELSIALSEKKK